MRHAVRRARRRRRRARDAHSAVRSRSRRCSTICSTRTRARGARPRRWPSGCRVGDVHRRRGLVGEGVIVRHPARGDRRRRRAGAFVAEFTDERFRTRGVPPGRDRHVVPAQSPAGDAHPMQHGLRGARAFLRTNHGAAEGSPVGEVDAWCPASVICAATGVLRAGSLRRRRAAAVAAAGRLELGSGARCEHGSPAQRARRLCEQAGSWAFETRPARHAAGVEGAALRTADRRAKGARRAGDWLLVARRPSGCEGSAAGSTIRHVLRAGDGDAPQLLALHGGRELALAMLRIRPGGSLLLGSVGAKEAGATPARPEEKSADLSEGDASSGRSDTATGRQKTAEAVQARGRGQGCASRGARLLASKG